MKNPKANIDKNRQLNDFELTEDETKILRIVLDYRSLTDKQIGEMVKLTRQQVNKIRNKPAFKKAFNEYQQQAIDIILSARPEAAIKMKKHINSKDERVSLKACEDVLGDILEEKKNKNEEKAPIQIIFREVARDNG